MYGFIVLRTYYNKIPRGFYSPLSVSGALVGILIFSVVFYSLAFCQADNYFAIQVFLGMIVIFFIPYYYHYNKAQGFSFSEIKILGRLHREKFARELKDAMKAQGTNASNVQEFKKQRYYSNKLLLLYKLQNILLNIGGKPLIFYLHFYYYYYYYYYYYISNIIIVIIINNNSII